MNNSIPAGLQELYNAIISALIGVAGTLVGIGIPVLWQMQKWKVSDGPNLQVQNANQITDSAMALVTQLRAEFDAYKIEAEQKFDTYKQESDTRLRKLQYDFDAYRIDAEARIKSLEDHNALLRQQIQDRDVGTSPMI